MKVSAQASTRGRLDSLPDDLIIEVMPKETISNVARFRILINPCVGKEGVSSVSIWTITYYRSKGVQTQFSDDMQCKMNQGSKILNRMLSNGTLKHRVGRLFRTDRNCYTCDVEAELETLGRHVREATDELLQDEQLHRDPVTSSRSQSKESKTVLRKAWQPLLEVYEDDSRFLDVDLVCIQAAISRMRCVCKTFSSLK